MPPFRSRLTIASEIPGQMVNEHARLLDLLDDIRLSLRAGQPVASMEAVLVRRLVADVARLVSREPGGRALRRLPPGPAIPAAALSDTLHDLDIALEAFRRAHSDPDSERDDHWLIASRAPRRPYLSPQ